MTNHLPECPHSNSSTVTFYGGYCVAVTDALEALDPLDPQTVSRVLAAIDALRRESDV